MTTSLTTLPKFFSNRATLLIIPSNCCRLPFDYKSPVGYTLAIVVQCFAVYMPLRHIECFMCFGVAIFLFSLSLAKDIGIFVRTIDKNAKAKKHRTIIYKQLCKTIQFTDLKRLVNLFDFFLSCHLEHSVLSKWMNLSIIFPRLLRDFSDIYEITFTVLFLGCTACIALALLMIQIELVNQQSFLFQFQ